MAKALETILEIDLKALKHNFEYLKSRIKPETKFLAVVKAFGYGSDACEIAKNLEKFGVDYFAVAYAEEGVSLRNAGIKTPILVLHPQPTNFKTLIDRCLEPSIYSFSVLDKFIKVSSDLGQTSYPIHIKFNTGLNRLGFHMNEVEELANKLINRTNIKVKSLFSHLAASEDLNEKEFTENQIQKFTNVSEAFHKIIGYKPILHISNTSGVLNYPSAQFNMIRCGIGLYGFGNSNEEDRHLKPIAALKSVISQIHTVQPGESVGYNRSFVAVKPTKTATIPIGHADGISRIYGHEKGYVIINEQQAPIIGNVCMDMIMVNITDINCAEGDEVIVFDSTYKASELSESVGTISYEILTSISQRVKRIFNSY